MENELRVQGTTTAKLLADFSAQMKRERKEDLDYLLKNLNLKPAEEYLTRNEVAQMLKVDLSTIHLWTKDGKLKRYGIGKRVYYKRSEIEEALVEIQAPKEI